MQVVCGNCQLSFEAPAGAAGLVCPICRGPLRPDQAAADAVPANPALDWDAGTLDDLIAILSPPATAARVEVFAVGNDTPVGEVHLLAGGVSDALATGVSPNDALDYLRGIKPAHFRVEQRLPNGADGDLTYPGPDAGTLDARPLAHLMRYCEQFVITCSIDVWRGNENARVEYRKGEINGVTVGGIDAPERLAEVMRWSSGNYRLVVPRLILPNVVPKAAASAAAATTKSAKVEPATPPAAAPAPRPPAPAPAAANRTIFGMPAADLASIRAATAGANAGFNDRAVPGKAEPSPVSAVPTAASVAPVAALSAAAASPAPPSASDRGSVKKTMFGVPAPAIALSSEPSSSVPAPKSRKQQKAAAAAAAAAARQERKMGARKTLVPPPEIIPPPDALDLAVAAADAALIGPSGVDSRSTQAGYGHTDDGHGSAAPALTAAASAAVPAPRQPSAFDENTSRMANRAPAQKEQPILAYVSVGFIFGLLLLGVYHLVGLLAH